MSTNLKWTREQELELVNYVAHGKSLEVYCQMHNRSMNAIELRLKKIVYENYLAGRSLETISNILKLNIEKVAQYYYSYKEFIEKKNGVNSQLNNQSNSQLNSQLNSHSIVQQKISNPPVKETQIQQIVHPTTLNTILNNQPQTNFPIGGIQSMSLNNSLPMQLVQNNIPLSSIQHGGSKIDVQIDKAFDEPNNMEKIESKLRKLEVENRILKLVVENKDLTQQLNKLISEKKVDPSIKQLIKTIRKSVK